MSNLLKITKPNGVIHTLPLSNKAFWQSYNKRLPANLKVKIEEVDENEKQPWRDPAHISPSQAIVKVDELQKDNEAKDAEIERLKQLVAGLQGAGTGTPPAFITAEDMISKIAAATTLEEVNKLVEGDTRKTVQDAAAKKINSLNNL